MRIPLITTLLIGLATADTTNVRIYHQAVASPATVQSKQIGVNTSSDATLGYKMWFGKDADGNVTQWLAKDKNARVLSLRQDSSFSKKDTSKFYKGDSAFFNGSKSSRLYYGVQRGDTSFTTYDTTKIIKADSGNFNRLKFGALIGGTKITADTIGAIHLLNLRKHSGTHFSGDGDFYYDSVHASLEGFTNRMSGTVNRCLFAQTDVVTDSGTASEISVKGVDSILLIDYPTIKDSLEANFFKVGKRLRFGIAGTYQTKAVSAGTVIIRLKLNNTLIDSVVGTLDNNEVDQVWRMDGAVVCKSTGVSGSVRCVTSWNHTLGSGVLHGDALSTLLTTVNTTIRQRFNLTFQFSDASFSTRANMIKSIVFYCEEVH